MLRDTDFPLKKIENKEILKNQENTTLKTSVSGDTLLTFKQQ